MMNNKQLFTEVEVNILQLATDAEVNSRFSKILKQ